MRRQTVVLLVLLMLIAAGATGTYFLLLEPDETNGASASSTADAADATAVSMAASRDALIASPQEIDLLLTVDIPKGSGAGNPDHQEITASGSIDYSRGDADLVYNFGELQNAAGHLGAFDTLDVIYVDWTGYLKIFVSGPPWLSIHPEDASNGSVLRLREVMLTTPMILPGLLDAAVGTNSGSRAPLLHEMQVSSLVDAEDEITAGIASALEELEVESVSFELSGEDDLESPIVVAFNYPDAAGTTEVRVTYDITPTDEQVSVEEPRPSRVRTFSSIFE